MAPGLINQYYSHHQSVSRPSKSFEPPTITVIDEASDQAQRLPTASMTRGADTSRYDKSTYNAVPLTLNGRLRAASVQGVSKKIFWSKASLRRVLTKESIEAQLELDRMPSKDSHSLSTIILENYLKVFAILTILGKHNQIYHLVDAEVSDETLPLQQSDRVHSFILLNGNQPACFHSWESWERDSFIKLQHQVNPVFLTHDGQAAQHKEFDDSVVLRSL